MGGRERCLDGFGGGDTAPPSSVVAGVEVVAFGLVNLASGRALGFFVLGEVIVPLKLSLVLGVVVVVVSVLVVVVVDVPVVVVVVGVSAPLVGVSAAAEVGVDGGNFFLPPEVRSLVFSESAEVGVNGGEFSPLAVALSASEEVGVDGGDFFFPPVEVSLRGTDRGGPGARGETGFGGIPFPEKLGEEEERRETSGDIFLGSMGFGVSIEIFMGAESALGCGEDKGWRGVLPPGVMSKIS
jgi:hypothetical protein